MASSKVEEREDLHMVNRPESESVLPAENLRSQMADEM